MKSARVTMLGFVFAVLLDTPGLVSFGDESSNMNTSFGEDLAFLKSHTPIVLLDANGAAVAIAPAYQGRVMTSTVDQAKGPSFGWINRKVIASGLLSEEKRKGKLEEHI